uniref:ribonuclease YeeF family protein n=1 Tax=Bacillus pumilus TaxID=1408 RepID=UPI003703A22D
MDARAKHYQEVREQMVDLKKTLQGMANLGDDFTGKGADNIKSFYKELAGNVDMFISFIDKQKAFHEGVSGTLDDTNFGGDTFVEEHFLDNAVHMGIKNAKSIVKDQKKALKTIFQDIDDLLSLEVFDSQTFDEKIADAEDERKKTVKDLRELDQNFKDEYALSETEQQATMALYAEMMNATNDGKAISPMNFDKKAYQNSEIYKAKSDIEKQTSEYLKIKKEQEEARKIAKEQEALANRPWYEKALDYGGNIVNELTGVNDAKRAATGVDPITGEELTAGQRVAADGMAAAGYIPIFGWAGRIFKGGKAVYKTTQATSAAVRAVDIYKTSQKSFDALKTSQKGLYGLTATNGFSEAITGRDMFGNKISKEQQEASMNAALGMLLPFGAKGFQGKMGLTPNISKRHDKIAHNHYYSRKDFRTQINNATFTEHGFKHLKAKTDEQAKLFSETGRKQAQYLPNIKNKVIEKEALKKGLIVENEKGAVYFIYNTGRPVGFDLGVETSWVRAELTSSGVFHGHPIAGNRLQEYLKIAKPRS